MIPTVCHWCNTTVNAYDSDGNLYMRGLKLKLGWLCQVCAAYALDACWDKYGALPKPTITKPYFCSWVRLGNDTWGVSAPAPIPHETDIVSVKTRDGTVTRQKLGKLLWNTGANAIFALAPKASSQVDDHLAGISEGWDEEEYAFMPGNPSDYGDR